MLNPETTSPDQWNWANINNLQNLSTNNNVSGLALTNPLQQSVLPKDARGPPGSNLFVYNIPDTYQEMDLITLFSTFGNLVSAHVQRDKTNGQSKGFGFVSFDNARSATQAISALDGFVVGNRKLNVRVKKDGSGGRINPY